MKLTVFAGTFNPIHIAHLILAELTRTYVKAEKFLFIPSYIPPHRDNEIAEASHRLEMVRLAIADNPGFEVSGVEFGMHGKSYTLNTIRRLYEHHPDIKGKINFIIGTDAFLNLERWHKPEELIPLVNFIILARKGSPAAQKIIKDIKFQDIDYKILETPTIEISSSFIRSRIKAGESIKYLVTEPVREYIQKNQLYAP